MRLMSEDPAVRAWIDIAIVLYGRPDAAGRGRVRAHARVALVAGPGDAPQARVGLDRRGDHTLGATGAA